MVLKQIKPIKKPIEEPEEELEEEQEEPESDLEEEEKQIRSNIKSLDERINKLKRPELKKVILKVINKEQIPYQRIEKVTGEDGEVYEVITIEEALAEILSILRESA